MDDESFARELRRLEQRAAGISARQFGHADAQAGRRNSRAGVMDHGVDARALMGPIEVPQTIVLAARSEYVGLGDDLANPMVLSVRHRIQAITLRHADVQSQNITVRILAGGVEVTRPDARPTIKPGDFVGRATRAMLGSEFIEPGSWLQLDVTDGPSGEGSDVRRLVALIHTRIQISPGRSTW